MSGFFLPIDISMFKRIIKEPIIITKLQASKILLLATFPIDFHNVFNNDRRIIMLNNETKFAVDAIKKSRIKISC